jgi:hypothetical protein
MRNVRAHPPVRRVKKRRDCARNCATCRTTVPVSENNNAALMSNLNLVFAGYTSQIEGLQKKLADLESAMRSQRDEFLARIAQRDDQIGDLNSEIARMIAQYQDLMDLKVQLDVELQAYQKLLEGEESRSVFFPSICVGILLNFPRVCRLHLTPASSPSHPSHQAHVSFTDSPSRRGMKRKRVLHESDESYGAEDQHTFKVNAILLGDLHWGYSW